MSKGMSAPRKLGKKLLGYFSVGLKTGPAWVPAVIATKDIDQGAEAALSTAMYEAVGYSLQGKKFSSAKFTEILARDAAMVGGGMLCTWLNKKI